LTANDDDNLQFALGPLKALALSSNMLNPHGKDSIL